MRWERKNKEKMMKKGYYCLKCRSMFTYSCGSGSCARCNKCNKPDNVVGIEHPFVKLGEENERNKTYEK